MKSNSVYQNFWVGVAPVTQCWVEIYLDYKNATHKKPYFFNQPDQRPGQRFEALVMGNDLGGGHHPPSPAITLPSLLSCNIVLKFQC